MRVGRILEATSTTLVAVFLAFAFEWRLATFLLMTFPLLAIGAFLELEILGLKSFVENSLADVEEEKASEVAVEALGKRSLSSFCLYLLLHNTFDFGCVQLH